MAGETLQRKNVSLDKISPFVIAAVIAAEDARFCSHHGIDRAAIEKAIEDNKKGGRRRGGSTITQQTAKNLFFWNGGGMARKAGEAYAALLIDLVWPKTTILQHYLNIAEWGDGIFGIEAAAQARFGKPAEDLSAYEAALLASVLPSPNKWRLDPPTTFVQGRARTINARLMVTAREGFGDCVLLGHPAYKRANFGATSVDAKEKLKDNQGAKPHSADTAIPQKTDDATSLDDVLSAAQIAAQAAREDTKAQDGAPAAAPAQPTDIRPPALRENRPAPENPQNGDE